MNCYLMEIGEVDPQDGRCEKCGKRAANPLLGIAQKMQKQEKIMCTEIVESSNNHIQ